MKKQLAIVLSILMVISLAACGSVPSTAGTTASSATAATSSSGPAAAFDSYARPAVVSATDVKIIYLISNMTDESNIRCEQQAAIEAAHRGWDYQVINYETEENFRQYFQNAINQQPTAIIIGITQAFASYQDLIATARNAGIGVYSNDNSIVDGVISNSTMDNARAAEMIMEQVVKDHPGTLNCTVYELSMAEVMTLRAESAKAYIAKNTGSLKLLESLDLASTGDLNTAGYVIAQTWIQKYGDELQFIFASADPAAMPASEAVAQAGDPTGAKTFVAGVDGGSASWNYIRNNTPLKYTYSQPFEFFTHQTYEIINQIQVLGLNPGDKDSLIAKAGDTVRADGIVTTVDNVPAVGDIISKVFNFYGEDANDKTAWYNWTDGPGIYTVTEAKTN